MKEIINKQFIKFILVGIINTIVGYGTYGILIYFNVNYLIANTISTIIGVINSYILNTKITFNESKKDFKTPFKFVSIYLISYLIGMLNLVIFVKHLLINSYIAGLLNICLTTIISYFGHKYFSFNSNKNKQEVNYD